MSAQFKFPGATESWSAQENRKRAWDQMVFLRFRRGPSLLMIPLLALQHWACASRDYHGTSNAPVEGRAGTLPSLSCEANLEYGYEQVTPLGSSALELVRRYGQSRSGALVGEPANLDVLNVPSGARPSLSISLQRAAGAVRYSSLCGLLTAPVVLTVTLSTGPHWSSPATLSTAKESPFNVLVRAAPNATIPFYLNAQLTAADTDVLLEPVGGSKPIRFTSLCGISVDPTIGHDFGMALDGLVALIEPVRWSCAVRDGTNTTTIALEPISLRLTSYGDEACRPHPLALPEFGISMRAIGSWPNAELLGRATLQREGGVPLLRYSVSGSVRSGDAFGQSVPCAVNSERIPFRLDGGIRGSRSPQSEPQAMAITFSCADLVVQCLPD